jgi:hypothetical protein
MRFFVHLLNIFPTSDKQTMRRNQENLIYNIVQSNYSKDYKIGYEKILETILGDGKTKREDQAG